MLKTVLIVDDSPSTSLLMKFSLKKAAFDVHNADNGLNALNLLENEDAIDCVVTDINMPEMNGIELIKRIRRMINYKFVPIIVMTNPDSPENKAKARDAGATAWIDKPFKPDMLLNVINKILRIKG